MVGILYTLQTRATTFPLSCLFRSLAFLASPQDLIVGFLVLSLFTMGCGTSNDALIQKYNDFAIKSAKAGLWREAMFRWQRIIEIDPDNAKAHNNLGVAYEALERFDEALTEYDKAIAIEPDNDVYQENHLRCHINRERGSKKKGAAPREKNTSQEEKLRNH